MNAELKFLIKVVKDASKLITSDIQITNFDYEIESFINKKIKEKYPTFDIISEEFNNNNTLSKNCFIVDPIDGTINFAHGLPLWGIQAACIKNGETCASVIYLPKLNELYFADKKNAFLNNKIIHVNNLEINKNLYVVEGPNRLPSQVRMKNYSPHCRDTWCAAVDFAWVASGVLGGTIFRKDSYWDYIPGQHIVKMAGGYIKNVSGGHIAANTKEFAELLEQQAKFIENDTIDNIK